MEKKEKYGSTILTLITDEDTQEINRKFSNHVTKCYFELVETHGSKGFGLECLV